MNVRRATSDDAVAVWTWRNDPVTRANSKTTEPIAWPEHRAWFERTLANSACAIYIATVDGEAIGMCRFDVDAAASSADVSIAIAPERRGQGYSVRLLRAAIVRFQRRHRVALSATIRRTNVASRHCFIACGFAPVAGDPTYEYFARPAPASATSRKNTPRSSR